MDLMNVPEPGASADPWAAGAGAAAASEDPWQPYGIHTQYIRCSLERFVCLCIVSLCECVRVCGLCAPPAALRTVSLC